MIGYMTKKEALAIGFTHHGSYYGIPIWISDETYPMVAAKWAPMEFLISTFHVLEGLGHLVTHNEPGFMFQIKDPI